MRNWKIPGAKTEKIDILLFDEFSNYCLANAVEPLRAANRVLGWQAYDWTLVTLDGKAVTSSSGMNVTPAAALSATRKGRALFVMPSYRFRRQATLSCQRVLRIAASRYDTMIGMDMGSWIMAAAGLLDNRNATVHWDEVDAMAEAFPETRVVRSKFVIDGDRWTCAGAMTAFDLLQYMIGQTHGEAVRLSVVALFVFDGTGTDYNAIELDQGTALAAKAVNLMRENLEHPLSVPQILSTLGATRAQLEQTFRREFGAPPKTVYRRLRLTAARRYAEQSRLSVAEIAVRTGYHNPSAMTRAFRQEFGISPSELRFVAD